MFTSKDSLATGWRINLRVQRCLVYIGRLFFYVFFRNTEQEKRISEALGTACLFINGV